MSKELEIGSVAYKDESCSMDGGYGFVIARNGDVWQLLKPFHHGVAIALLEPLRAKESGIGTPIADEYSVYDYQDFEHSNTDLGYIRVGIGIFNRVSIGYKVGATKEQIESLAKWLTQNDMMDDKFTTDIGECRGRNIINELKKSAFDDMLDLTLNEPEEKF